MNLISITYTKYLAKAFSRNFWISFFSQNNFNNMLWSNKSSDGIRKPPRPNKHITKEIITISQIKHLHCLLRYVPIYFWIWKERTYKMYLSKTINLCLNELDCSFDGFGGWSSYHAIQYWIPLLQWSLVVICFEVSHLAFFRCYRFLRFYLDFGSNCFGPIYGKSKTGWPKSKVAI